MPDGNPYLGTDIVLNADFSITVETTNSFRDMPLWIEAFMDPVTQSDCTFIQPVHITLDVEVCGTEVVSIVNQSDPIEFHDWTRWQPNYVANLTYLKQFLSVNST